MRPVRIIAAVLFAATVGTLTPLAAPAWAESRTPPVAVHASPSPVAAGHAVILSGSVGPVAATSDCSSIILYSDAFDPVNRVGHLIAVYATAKPTGAFAATTTIPRSKPAGTYPIYLRCGGATIGGGTLVVRATTTTTGPSLVPLGSHQFGHLRAPDAIVAQAGPNQVGFSSPPKGADGLSFGPWSFDVARDGSIWLLDEVNYRLLVWQPGRPAQPARTVRLPQDPLERIADFAVAFDGTIYATYVPPPGAGPKTLRLCALTPSGQVRWTAPTIDQIFNARLRIGTDGALYVVGGLEQASAHEYWTPLTTPAGRPLPLAEQRRRTSPRQPLPGGLRLATTYVSAHEQHVTLSNQAGQPVRGWRITSHNELGPSTATPALVGGDPVVVFGISQQTKAKFLYEDLVLRLAPAGGTRQRFALKPESRAVWGDTPITGVRVGPDGQLYQLRTDRATGASIARYLLASTQVAPPTTTPAPTAPPATAPPMTHPPVSQPTVSAPVVTGSPTQPATPAAAQSARRWIIPGLAAVGSGTLAALGVWLLYRRRHPVGASRQGRSGMAH
jgi:hypothetical protein